MKNLILSIAIITSTFTLNAQTRIGLEAGTNIASVSYKFLGNKVSGIKSIYYINCGFNFETPIQKSFYFQSGLHFEGKGYKILPNSSNHLLAPIFYYPLFITLPINAVYKINTGSGKVILNAGPYLSYGIAGNAIEAGTKYKIKWGNESGDFFNPLDFGANIGVGYEKNNGYFARLQYGLGIANEYPNGNSSNSINNKVFSITLGRWFDGNKNAKVGK